MSIRNRCQIVGKKPLWVDNENGETFENLTEKKWGDFFVHSDHHISFNTTHFLFTEEEIWKNIDHKHFQFFLCAEIFLYSELNCKKSWNSLDSKQLIYWNLTTDILSVIGCILMWFICCCSKKSTKISIT